LYESGYEICEGSSGGTPRPSSGADIAEAVAFFCTECGWTVPQVFEHTREELAALSEKICKKIRKRLAWEAKLHGSELKEDTFEREEDVRQTLARAKKFDIPVEVH
jgi:imidazolonepropionase-like amidohydrolase